MLTVGSLFTGIGGFDLGLERAGMRVLWQCEIDPFAQRVLEKHWPDVLRVPDIREIGAGTVPAVDVICGGFPCQDLSYAGKGAGINGARSGLWAEMFRAIDELRPRYVIVENVAALLARGLDRVLGDLASIGFDAEWDCIRASDVGAPHRRERVWIVAYPQGVQRPALFGDEPDGDHPGAREVAYANGERGNGTGSFVQGRQEPAHGRSGDIGGWWAAEPDLPRVAHGIPNRVDRLRSLGNALVPQIAEWLGHRIVAYEEGRLAA